MGTSTAGVARGVIAEEVMDCFIAYEAALVTGNVAVMDSWFADDPRTVRFGIADEQWGADEVRRWRASATPVPAGRHLTDTRVDVWSDDLAVVTTLFTYPTSNLVGRQSQTWCRTTAGWRIVHAHVSERG